MKQTKFAIAVALYNPDNPSEVLAVKRPADDDSLPNVWGLPAVSVKDGELPEDAVKRLGLEKLSTDIIPVSYIGVMRSDRRDFELILMDIKSELRGTSPNVRNANTTSTKYVDQQWTSDYSVFIEAAKKGSLCSKIFLSSKNVNWD